MEDGGDLALREMGQEIFHRLVWELEGKLHYWLPERTPQLKSGWEGGWSGRKNGREREREGVDACVYHFHTQQLSK